MKDAEPTDPAATTLVGRHAWLLLAAVMAAQVWGTLGLFGPDRPLARLLDDEPIVSGRHALHFYHGLLGARSLWERGTPSCYDPSFHAGYPKTPIFDSGSRSAELTLTLLGGRSSPAAYKLSLAILCLATPLVLWFSARNIGLQHGAAGLAAALAAAIWWSHPCREALRAGATDLLLAAVVLPLFVGLLLRHHYAPGVRVLLVLTLAAALGWFGHPPLFALFIPLFFVYYVTAGPRHALAWHAALWGSLLIAVGVNAFWLVDWVDYWWIRSPAAPTIGPGQPALWDVADWGGSGPRALAVVLLVAAAVGIAFYRSARRRPETRLLGLGTAWLLVCAALAARNEYLQAFGGTRLVVPALLFAVLPAAHAASELCARLRHRLAPAGVALTLSAAAAGTGFAARGDIDRTSAHEPLQLGISPAASSILELLRTRTTADARILWEDRHLSPAAPRWTPLLPLWTDRAFIGGLDPEAGIEHAAAALTEGTLAGRPLTECSDADLADYCQRYNIGWVACWSPRSVERFHAWSGARELTPLPACDGGEESGCLFVLDRPHDFALTGSARWITADAQRIVLADVRPRREDGRGLVVLSLHYQAGMHASPSRVRVERAEDPRDPIPFVRLVVTDPVARVTLTWDRH